ncbi:methyltransferase, partial [Arthrospira platensis SPKY1]|nr:methyltransferase [Arthrospira platensis SPKY1]
SSMALLPGRNYDFSSFGIVLMQLGLLIHVGALLSLNRSFGIFPANRGIISRGLYAFVRHPLYTSVIITTFGYLIANPTVYNLLVLVVTTAFHVLRITEEEKVLTRDPEYKEYGERVRWRLVPRVW